MKTLIIAALETFKDILTPINCPKGELLLRENKTSKALFLVKQGLLRSFYYKNGKDITAYFAIDYDIIGAADSIIKNEKSIYNIEALEDSTVYKLDYDRLEQFLDEHPKHERLARRISQALYMDLVERMEGMAFLTAKERYDHLLEKHPKLTQRVSLGHIASYLSISQETLSRIRREK